MSDTGGVRLSPQGTGMKKTLSLWNFFTIGFGATIGTGWVLLVGDWMIIGGGPLAAILAFAVGAVFLLPMSAVFGELAAAIPLSGGTVEYVHRAFGDKASYYTGWLIVLGKGILCPWETLAIATLVSERFGALFPILRSIKLYTIFGADVFLFPTLIALAVGIYVSYLNFKGASSAAKLQSFLFKALMLGMVLAMAISLIKGGPQNMMPLFSQVVGPASSTKVSNIFMGMLSVLVMTPFFFSGFDTAPQQAEEAAEGLNWNKFAKVVGLALLAAGLFYILAIYSFGTIIPWTEFIQSSVPALACLKDISIILYVVMLSIATLGPMGPMNSSFGASSRILLAMGRKKQIPEAFTKLDLQKGTPIAANIIMCVLTLAGPFLGKKMLLPLTNVSSLAFIFSYTMVSFACLRLRKTEPDLLRPYRVPGGIMGVASACLAGCVIIGLMVVPFSPAALTPLEWIITGTWVLIGLALSVISGNKRKQALK
ncbi:MAG: APC family permease [Oscillospiraceae bacterium]